jgi:hypothetical protein
MNPREALKEIYDISQFDWDSASEEHRREFKNVVGQIANEALGRPIERKAMMLAVAQEAAASRVISARAEWFLEEAARAYLMQDKLEPWPIRGALSRVGPDAIRPQLENIRMRRGVGSKIYAEICGYIGINPLSPFSDPQPLPKAQPAESASSDRAR